jgi:hypothetical protein
MLISGTRQQKTVQATSHCVRICVTFGSVDHFALTLRDLTKSKTTISALKFVGRPVLTSKWFSGFFIDFLTGFVSSEMDLARLPLRIEISDWIRRVENLESPYGIGTLPWHGLRGLYDLIDFMRRLQNPGFAEPLLREVALICSPDVREKVQRSLENLDFAEVNRLCNEVLRKAGGKSTFDALALLVTTRAAQTVYRCIARYRVSPIELIDRASNGDRKAVLDLIKVDKLFLFDSCTQDTLQKGLLSGDKLFNDQVARAQLFKPKFSRRQACEIYMLLLAAARVPLPPLHKLKTILDPSGESFPGLYDFEKCFERRQKEIRRPLENREVYE